MSAAAPSCGRSFSPQYFWARVPAGAVQDCLREVFAVWGLPEAVRVDNGSPWGSWSDLPPLLALWLVGCAIDMVWNDPCRPQQNGVVERSQGTGQRWAEPGSCPSAAVLQQRLDEADWLQRSAYPYRQGHSREEVWPQLRHSGRPYTPAWEEEHWSLTRVRQHLAGYAVPRRVDRTGNVSLYDRNCYVGVRHRGRTVWVMFDPNTGEWVIADEHGQQLRSRPAELIRAETIRQLPGSRAEERL